MVKYSWLARLTGTTHGFVIGAVLSAWIIKRLGGWPPSETYLRKIAQPTQNSVTKNETA